MRQELEDNGLSGSEITIGGMLTTKHELSKRADDPPFHALCCDQELNTTLGFSVHLQTKEGRIDELDSGKIYFTPGYIMDKRAWLLCGAATKMTGPSRGILKAPLGRTSLKNIWVMNLNSKRTQS